MYIAAKNDRYVCRESAEGEAFAEILPAVIVEKGGETVPSACEWTGDTLVSHFAGLDVSDTYSYVGNGLFSVTRRLVNLTEHRVRVKSIFEIKTVFAANHYVFPGLNYNGNEWGSPNVPKGLSTDGQPWVFAYDREGIPSCTVSEDGEHFAAIFASDRDSDSLRSSASLIKENDGSMRHRIFHPVSEMPYTYARKGKNAMVEPCEEYFSIVPGGIRTLRMFVCVGKPVFPNYGCANVMEACDAAFAYEKEPVISQKRIWELGISNFRSLLKDCKGHTMVSGHLSDRLFVMMHAGNLIGDEMKAAMEDPANTCLSVYSSRYEIGWADQNAMIARLFALDGYENSRPEEVALGMGILDAYAASQWENGLLYPQYSSNYIEDESKRQLPDACNMGWALTEFSRSYSLFGEKGTDKPEYREFVRRLADFAVKTYSPEYGFGKTWNRDGSPKATEGTAGGFMIMGLLEAYGIIPDKAYLDAAVKAMDFYCARDLDNFVCTAGALDCLCVDKETSYPFVTSALRLFELTGDKKWLERAEKAAYYFFSWMFWYDALYPDDSEFTKYGYSTTGATLIEAELYAVDQWGALLVPELIKLWHITGNGHFRRWARMTWCNSLLCVTCEEGQSVHGNVRPLGSQNEGFFQCRWTKYRPTCEERGHLNDNLQTWMGAWRLNTLSSLSKDDLKILE